LSFARPNYAAASVPTGTPCLRAQRLRFVADVTGSLGARPTLPLTQNKKKARPVTGYTQYVE
jgi:hypothetical protein